MPLTILTYGDCTSYNGRIRENVGLARFHCNISEQYLHTPQTSLLLPITANFCCIYFVLSRIATMAIFDHVVIQLIKSTNNGEIRIFVSVNTAFG